MTLLTEERKRPRKECKFVHQLFLNESKRDGQKEGWYMYTVNSLLTDTSFKADKSGHVELVPAILQSFTSSPSKVDTSLRWTVGAGPEWVHLQGS